MGSVPKLMVLSEKFRGLVFEITKDQVSVGRRDECDICIKDGSISGHHCEIIHDAEGYWFKDNESTNGSRINNVPVDPAAPVLLKGSDLLQLGSVEVLFDYDDGSGPIVTKTQTGIDLTAADSTLSTVRELNNLSPFAQDDTEREDRSKKLTVGAGILIGILILAGLIWLLGKIIRLLC